MTTEEKEMIERFEKEFIAFDDMKIVDGFSCEEIEAFILKETRKAREEGYMEGIKNGVDSVYCD